MKRPLKRKKYKRFYATLVLVNLIIFNLVISVLGIIAYSANYRTDMMSFLRQYDEKLLDLTSYYNAKHHNYFYLMFPLFRRTDVLDDINRFLDDPTDTLINTDPAFTKRLLAILEEISERDRDIAMIYISKSLTGSVYGYNIFNHSLSRLYPDIPFTDVMQDKNGQRMISAAQVVPTSLRKANQDSLQIAIYCIAGTINSKSSQAGLWNNILIGYRSDAFDRFIQEYAHDSQIRYGLMTLNGHLIYDSWYQYSQEGYTTLDIKDQILNKDERLTIDGSLHIKRTWYDPVRGLVAFYLMPQAYVSDRIANKSAMILIFVLAFMAISVIIYLITIQSSGKRVLQLERGMQEISRHNLTYRIPEMKQNDEISLMAERFNEMCEQLQETINRCYLYNIRQKEASFFALQTSINPHFLYNTLEAVRSRLALSGHLDESVMIVMLSRLFDYQIRGASFVTIGEEIDALELYISFFAIRYDDSFQYSVEIEPDVRQYALPKFTLQPILENYFIHGIREGDDNFIHIHAEKVGGDIHIVVQDNGQGISADQLQRILENLSGDKQEKSSYGLMNVHQRLRYAFDEPCGISKIYSAGCDQGTEVHLLTRAMRVKDLIEQYSENDSI